MTRGRNFSIILEILFLTMRWYQEIIMQEMEIGITLLNVYSAEKFFRQD